MIDERLLSKANLDLTDYVHGDHRIFGVPFAQLEGVFQDHRNAIYGGYLDKYYRLEERAVEFKISEISEKEYFDLWFQYGDEL